MNDVKTNWKSVSVYYFLACAWSWPFFWWRDLHNESWKVLQIPEFSKTWLLMWGPGLAALICLLVFKSIHKRQMTFAGTSLWRGIIFVALLPVVLALLNQDFRYLQLGVLGFIATLGEELGWRGFLQDALKFKNDYLKALIIGTMWELWHFTNRTANSLPLQAVIRVSIFIAALSVLSLLMIKLTKKTHSILVAVALHLAFNVSFEVENGWQSVVICLPLWFVLYRNWISSKESYESVS
jgi:membrane protease YdiL (CAAX protease family)